MSPAPLDSQLKANAGTEDRAVYSGTKFVQLLGAHWWRRQLRGSCHVVAVSPGLVPNTGIARHGTIQLNMQMPDAKTVPEGKQILPDRACDTTNGIVADDSSRCSEYSSGLYPR